MKFLGKMFQKLNIPGLGYLDYYLLTSSVSNSSKNLFIFIIGPPRVGSTLLYQLMAASNFVDFINNFEHVMYKYPALGFYLSKKYINSYFPSYSSSFGYEKGLSSPSEANSFWNYWFGMYVAENINKFNNYNKNYINKYFNYRLQYTKKPFVAAWNAHAFYINEIKKIFPNALFIHVIRDPLKNALSILNARQRLKGSIEKWWSLRPEECSKELFESPFYQVMAQIFYTNNRIEQFKDDMFLTIKYNDICAQPIKVLNHIAERIDLKSHDNRLNFSNIPKYFDKSNSQIPVQWQDGLYSAYDFFYSHR